MDYLPADNLVYKRLERKGESFEALVGEVARMDDAPAKTAAAIYPLCAAGGSVTM